MELFLPFNSVDGDRRHNAEGLAEMIKTMLTNGVSPQPEGGFFVTAGTGWAVNLAPGRCVIEGRIGINLQAKPLAITPSGGAYDRIDRVVLRCDYLARQIVEVIKTGTPASNPQPPALQRDEDAYEISLAQVRVGKNAMSITQGAITDERLNNAVCGIVSAVVPLDAGSFFVGMQAAFSEWRTAREQEFLAWFSALSVVLEGDVAASLAGAVALLRSEMDGIMPWAKATQKPMYTAGEVGAVALVGGKADPTATSASTVSVTSNKTLALTDAGTVQRVNSSSDRTITVPTNASVAFPIGTEIEIKRYGAGEVTIAGASGVTVNNADGAFQIEKQFVTVALKKEDTNTWTLEGRLK